MKKCDFFKVCLGFQLQHRGKVITLLIHKVIEKVYYFLYLNLINVLRPKVSFKTSRA